MQQEHSEKPIHLSPREIQLAALVSRGQQNKEIAYALGLTPGTVKVYLHHLFPKLGISNRAELAVWAVRHENELLKGDFCGKLAQLPVNL